MLRSKKYDFFSISKEKVISRNVQPSGIYFIWKNRIQLKEDDQGKKNQKSTFARIPVPSATTMVNISV